MINCSITSRLDYCNSLLYGAEGHNIYQLQLCLNNAPRCCPCAPNSIVSLQFWKTYTGCLLSKRSNTRCCCSLIELCMVNPLHSSHSCCLCILQPGPCDQRANISSEYQDAVWKGSVDAALRMPLHLFGTLSLHLLNVPLPLIPSRAVWRLTNLTWHIPRSTDSYCVWVYCLWLV